MADYYAVLKRTLSGFSDPKPQLRTKLYERARATIQRQLEGRSPALEHSDIQAELDKLEGAVTRIELEYDPSFVPDVLGKKPEEDDARDSVPAPPAPKPEATTPAPAEPAKAQPPATNKLPPAADLETSIGPSTADVEATAADKDDEEAVYIFKSSKNAKGEQTESGEAAPAENRGDPARPSTASSAAEVEKAKVIQAAKENAQKQVDPADEWAKRFLENPAAADESPKEEDKAAVARKPHPLDGPPAKPDPELPETAFPRFEPSEGESLEIPASVDEPRGSARPHKTGNIGRWVFLLFVCAIIGVAGYFAWGQRQPILAALGLDGDDLTKPKPVKTISIKPDPEPAPDSSQTSQTPANRVDDNQPKSEERLTPDGDEIASEAPAASPQLTPGVDPADNSGAISAANPPPGGPAVAQRAILYEEGSSAAQNSFDSGRVVWSIVEEDPGGGAPKEPAIRARMEVPDRNVVLLMTIKRNADKALPASHLIELVFAVPDDFSGGAIGEINRYVLKESEQGRGEALVGVPARISEGIFLIALNNLDQARTRNEGLLKSGGWIDIPVKYRTGRRALVTLEKGVPGEAVFKQAFDSWEKIAKQP